MGTRVLIIDDDTALRRSLRRVLLTRGYEVEEAGTGEEGLERLATVGADLVLLDLVMPGIDGLEVLRRMKQRGKLTPTVMMSGTGTIATAVEAIRLGATDFVEKGANPERVLLSLRNALRYRRLEAAHERLLGQLPLSRDMLGESAPMEALRQRVLRVARAESRVLILGENGTGKELVARMLHEASRRADGPFITLNCAAVPSELIESEMFGHEAGAFTGARRTHQGRFERANGGTLFLDEVGDMPLPMQAKLLRALQEGEIERVGGTEVRKLDVRVVAATNQDLQARIADGSFREDLYYRLAVIVLRTPPLRDRVEDIPELVARFAAEAGERNGLEPPVFTDAAIEALQEHDWPGNVRQLQNIVERLVILVDGPVDRADVLAELPGRTASLGTNHSGEAGKPLDPDLDPMVAERERLILALERAGHQKQKAAELLNMSRSTLWRKLKAHGLE